MIWRSIIDFFSVSTSIVSMFDIWSGPRLRVASVAVANTTEKEVYPPRSIDTQLTFTFSWKHWLAHVSRLHIGYTHVGFRWGGKSYGLGGASRNASTSLYQTLVFYLGAKSDILERKV